MGLRSYLVTFLASNTEDPARCTYDKKKSMHRDDIFYWHMTTFLLGNEQNGFLDSLVYELLIDFETTSISRMHLANFGSK